MTTTKEFGLGAVLSITDGRMLAPFDEIHELATWLAGEPVWTHQLPRVMDEAKPFLVAQFPGIDDVEVPDGLDSFEKVGAFLTTLSPRFPDRLAVTPLQGLEHTSIDPISELMMARTDANIVVVVSEDDA